MAQCVIFAVLRYIGNNRKESSSGLPKELVISTRQLIGDSQDLQGSITSGYTLVEFGDYQCPPCAKSSGKVQSLLVAFPDKLSFRFRHYPLPSHEYALRCAILAEEARDYGVFWKVHEQLYGLQAKISDDAIKQIYANSNIKLSELSTISTKFAKKRIETDIKLANSFNIQFTPTFVLCCPDGTPLLLTSLDQADMIISTNIHGKLQ